MGISNPYRTPQFAGLRNYDPQALLGQLPTPCLCDRPGAAAGKRGGARRPGRAYRLSGSAGPEGFSNYDLYPLLAPHLAGTEASGLYEARLGKEEMPQGEVHVFCGAYREDEFEELLQYADHIVFNSIHQLKAFGPRASRRAKAWACVSIPSAPPRRAMPSTTPAPPAAVWG